MDITVDAIISEGQSGDAQSSDPLTLLKTIVSIPEKEHDVEYRKKLEIQLVSLLTSLSELGLTLAIINGNMVPDAVLVEAKRQVSANTELSSEQSDDAKSRVILTLLKTISHTPLDERSFNEYLKNLGIQLVSLLTSLSELGLTLEIINENMVPDAVLVKAKQQVSINTLLSRIEKDKNYDIKMRELLTRTIIDNPQADIPIKIREGDGPEAQFFKDAVKFAHSHPGVR